MFAFAWVEALVLVFEVCAVDVRVDLRGGDVRVAEELLHDAEVGAADEHVGREGMAEHVRMHLGAADGAGGSLDDLVNGDALERSPCAREQQLVSAEPGAAVELWAAVLEVLLDGIKRGLRDGDDALLVPLADDGEHALLDVHAAEVERADFACAQAARVEEVEQRAVAEVEVERVFSGLLFADDDARGGGLDEVLDLAMTNLWR